MLVLTRRPGEAIQIGDDIQVAVLQPAGQEMRIAATVSSPVTVAWTSDREARIGDEVQVSVLGILREALRLGVEAPRWMPVYRKEIYDELEIERRPRERERPAPPPEGLDPPATDVTPRVVALAGEEARNLKHNYIGTEHLLLALLREEEGGVVAHVLESFDLTIERVRAQIVRVVGLGEEVTSAPIPFTPRARKVLERRSEEEAESLHHDYIGTEHILLGLTREKDGIAARVLRDLDVESEQVRDGVMRRL
jgi:carbon storage regulator CsrA